MSSIPCIVRKTLKCIIIMMHFFTECELHVYSLSFCLNMSTSFPDAQHFSPSSLSLSPSHLSFAYIPSHPFIWQVNHSMDACLSVSVSTSHLGPCHSLSEASANRYMMCDCVCVYVCVCVCRSLYVSSHKSGSVFALDCVFVCLHIIMWVGVF